MSRPVRLQFWCPRGHYVKIASGAAPGRPLLPGEMKTAERLFERIVHGHPCPACEQRSREAKAQPNHD